VDVEVQKLWNIPPIAFDPELRDVAGAVIEELTGGESPRMDSGALHDAAEVARAGVPTVMLFVKSLGGISHAKVEDSADEDLALSVRALAMLVARAMTLASARA
jgi:acetylornithine deacetylase/succinyl-diaminopimelate desuccinylase-like protein